MKYIEYQINKLESEDSFTKELFSVTESVNGIIMPFHGLGIAEEMNLPSNIRRIVVVDHPLGLGDKASRSRATQSALNSGANTIDIMANIFLLKERLSDFNKEIKALKKLCDSHKAELRVTLDYRNISSTSEFIESWKHIVKCGIDLACPSNGFFVDDFCDNLMMCSAIESRYGIRTICTGNLYRETHFDMIKGSSIYGLRVSNLNLVNRVVNGV